MPDPYIQPNGCLKNKLRIADPDQLEAAERRFTRARLDAIDKNGPKGRIDFARMKATHVFIFGDVYVWAGVPRATPLGKAAIEGGHASWFTPPEDIESEATAPICAIARAEWIQGTWPAGLRDQGGRLHG